ncbi:hypothetical protein IKF12_01495 [Candidatus Saccharibacteria bacterium]|nr:hypothetical protein [Candidatus Saccharibacteria bacterium]
MKTIHGVVIALRILLILLVIGFIILTFMGVTGSVMTLNGVILLFVLLGTRYLSKLCDLYEQRYAARAGGEDVDQPLSLSDCWGFDPLNYLDGSFDIYIKELVKFVESDDEAEFVPSDRQRFQVWWNDYTEKQHGLTGRITKMSHTPDHRILFETDTGVYVGDPRKCSDIPPESDEQ